MRLFFAAFALALRRLLRRPAVITLLAAMPATALAMGMFFGAGTDGGTVLVGLSVPAGSARARAAVDWLLAGQGAIRFAEIPDGSTLEQDVAAGTYNFGYRFAQDFDQRSAEGNWRGAVTRVTTPAAPFYPALDDRVAAAVLHACWPDLAQRALAREGYPAGAGALAAAAGGPAQRMELRVETAPGAAAQEHAATTGAGLLPGVIAIFLFAFMMLAVTDFTLALRQGFFSRLRPFTGTAALFVPELSAALLAGWFSATAALLVGFLFSAAPAVGAAAAAALLVLYTLYLAGAAVLLCALFARRVFPVALVPFCVVACVVFCPFLSDVTTLLPAARPVAALLPPTLFLRAAAGDAVATLWMAGGAVALGGAGAAIFRLRRKTLLSGA